MNIQLKKLKGSRRIYVANTNLANNICPICINKSTLYVHHIIPKRLNLTNNSLKELVMKICKSCHTQIHPENSLYLEVKTLEKSIQNIVVHYKAKTKRAKKWEDRK